MEFDQKTDRLQHSFLRFMVKYFLLLQKILLCKAQVTTPAQPCTASYPQTYVHTPYSYTAHVEKA